jgi:hypothetical protein
MQQNALQCVFAGLLYILFTGPPQFTDQFVRAEDTSQWVSFRSVSA